MIGSSDFHAYGYSARRPVAVRQRGQHHAMRALAPFQSTTAPTLLRKILVLAARLRRFLNGQVAAAIAHHEREAASFAQRKLDQRRPDQTRIYCGPIDQVLAAARQRKRAA
ncbi:hypothetical protein [Bradyrhizobium sp. AUGA SZCCT0431]|uniref:hypothetical protein n=1 Tax=Bradyrhizobium sp. AUGA SZCCT0431 TaxID=2807674 RepID=UPI001BA703A8|nr:hypothetical protein [Bradyrhizobium sp. AUGA SZCCT0431]MBR1146972.1 hypothetical protein [Bradyrhizobium sp. AUGA SZCCT0431]